MRVAVTGGSGKVGRAVVRDLLAHGHSVRNIDRVPDPEPVCGYRRVDLENLGHVFEVFDGCDAVVHLAATTLRGDTEHETFRSNVIGTFNVFSAACQLKMRRVVWASSETALGLPFDDALPYLPLDEEPRPTAKSAYALSKVLGEEMARYFNARSGVPFVGLRFSNVWTDNDYARVPEYHADIRSRSWNAWGYVDARDIAQACRLGVEAETTGAEVFIIAAADTVMDRTNAELVAEVFPRVPLLDTAGEHGTLLSIDKARRVLGYEPVYSWRTR